MADDDPRSRLLTAVAAEVAASGLGDRSLRDLAGAVGSSHRMLLYHFGSRAGLVAALVELVETSQRALLVELAAEISDPGDLVLALWARVSSPELRPFVRLFFECVGATGGIGLTEPWLETSLDVAAGIAAPADADLLRLGVAVTRGLLIDVLATDDVEPATRSIERFVELWRAAGAD